MQKLSNVVYGIADNADKVAVYNALKGIYDRFSSCCLSTAGLAIKTGGSLLVSVKTACKVLADGKLVTVGTQDCAVLAGTINIAKYNVFCFFCDSAGTLTTAMGTEATLLSDVKFPPIPEKKAMIGFITILGGDANAFIGNDATSGVLDSTTYAKTITYTNTPFPFDSTATI
jgi:hypothetical protein